jgi:hypothetical protein
VPLSGTGNAHRPFGKRVLTASLVAQRWHRRRPRDRDGGIRGVRLASETSDARERSTGRRVQRRSVGCVGDRCGCGGDPRQRGSAPRVRGRCRSTASTVHSRR